MKFQIPTYHAFLLALVLLALSAKGIYWVWHDTSLAIQSTNWKTADAFITVSKISMSMGNKQIQWAPEVRYHFSVNEKIFTGDTISFPSRRGSKHEAMKKISMYPAGSERKIFYNPENPSESCLEQGYINYFFIIIIGSISLLLGAGGIFVIYFAIKKKR